MALYIFWLILYLGFCNGGRAAQVLAPALLALLSACAAATPPPTAPTTTQIAAVRAELQAAGLSPSDYANIGITLAQRNCAEWFSQQVVNAQGSAFGASALSMLGGAAAAAGGPVGVGAGVGASLAASLLGQAQASFGAGSNPAAIYGLVKRVQDAWLEAMPVPLTEADALALVEDYAQRCELPGILTAVADALHSVSVTAAVLPTTTQSMSLTPRSQPQIKTWQPIEHPSSDYSPSFMEENASTATALLSPPRRSPPRRSTRQRLPQRASDYSPVFMEENASTTTPLSLSTRRLPPRRSTSQRIPQKASSDKLQIEQEAIARYGRAAVENGRVPLPRVRIGP